MAEILSGKFNFKQAFLIALIGVILSIVFGLFVKQVFVDETGKVVGSTKTAFGNPFAKPTMNPQPGTGSQNLTS